MGARLASMVSERRLGEVTVADRRDGPAPPGIERIVLDIADDDALAAALAAHDVVVNTVGPFDVWGTRLLGAAIEAGTDYVDICDDPLPTLDLLALHERAVEAGVRAVVGLGASPGLSNLLGVVAASRLDEVDTLVTFWGDPVEELSPEDAPEYATRVAQTFVNGRAAIAHLFAQATGTVPVWRDGSRADVRPWASTFEVRLSGGERGTYRLVGHPEPVTLPSRVAVRDACTVGSLGRKVDEIVEEVVADIDAGRTTVEEAPGLVAERILADPARLVSRAEGPPLPAHIGAVAVGRRDGRPCAVTALPGGPTDGSMSFETARPAVLGLAALAEAPLGVHAPESAFDAETFLALFSDREWSGAPPYRLDERFDDIEVPAALLRS